MRRTKLFLTMLLTMVMLFAASVVSFAETADDYTFAADEALDFCVYNIWSDSYIEKPMKDIVNIKMTVEVSEFAGEAVSVKLYSREQVTWLTWASEPQTISADGTYSFVVTIGKDAPVAPDNLCTIYLKDSRCCTKDEDAELGQELGESGFVGRIKLVSVEYNVEDGASEPAASEDASEDSSETVTSAETTEGNTTTAAATTEASKSTDKKDGGSPVVIIIIVVVVIVAAVGVVFLKKKKS